VTHDMNWVTEFCNRAMLLEKGNVVAEGEPAEIVALHQEHMRGDQVRRYAELVAKLGDSPGFTPFARSAQAAIKAAREAGMKIETAEDIQAAIKRHSDELNRQSS